MPGRWGTRIAAVCFIAISLYVWAEAIEFPVGGGTFPLFTAGSAIVLCLIMLAGSFPEWADNIRNFLKRSDLPGGKWLASMFRRGDADRDARITFDFSYGKMKPLLIVVFSVIYVLAMFWLGYFAASILFLGLTVWMVGVRSIRAIALTAVILFPLMYVFFVVFLRANLPKGILF
jgi:hypothetical protein